MALGLNLTSETKDFAIENNKITYLSDKERALRNFRKGLITQSGNLTQAGDTRVRYNPLYGLDYDKLYAPSNSVEASIKNIKVEVERVCKRFIDGQKTNIEYYSPSEVIAKYEVIVTPGDAPSMFFNVLLWTVEDVQLGRTPSFDRTFSTEPLEE